MCPSCGAKYPLEAALQDARARAALHRALRIAPSLADPIVAYLALHSPDDTRAIRMDKLARLLGELADAIEAAQVERNGRAWAAPLELWRDALARVLAQRDAGKLTLPLSGHGLLYEIVAGLASRAEGRREARREERRQHGEGARSGAPRTVRTAMPDHLKGGAWRHSGGAPEGESS